MIIDRKAIEMLLAKNCLSQTKLVSISGVSQTTLSKAMNGHDTRPVSVGKIARALGVDPEQIIAGD